MHAQEAERHRVAGDLHDLIGQKLTALGINLDIVRQQMPQAGASTVAGRLHQIATLLEETIGAVRGVISDLRPQVLDEHGLSAALHQHAAEFEARTGLRVEVSGAEPRLPLPRDVAIALFRIAQEALTNAAKHSGASRARVRVRKSPAGVELMVEDDGCGLREMSEERPRDGRGWGLRMMRERAEAVGGRLVLGAAHPGTRVIVEIPVSRADQRHPG
jgi:two-component system sensor histidine kinase UhpB